MQQEPVRTVSRLRLGVAVACFEILWKLKSLKNTYERNRQGFPQSSRFYYCARTSELWDTCMHAHLRQGQCFEPGKFSTLSSAPHLLPCMQQTETCDAQSKTHRNTLMGVASILIWVVSRSTDAVWNVFPKKSLEAPPKTNAMHPCLQYHQTSKHPSSSIPS